MTEIVCKLKTHLWTDTISDVPSFKLSVRSHIRASIRGFAIDRWHCCVQSICKKSNIYSSCGILLVVKFNVSKAELNWFDVRFSLRNLGDTTVYTPVHVVRSLRDLLDDEQTVNNAVQFCCCYIFTFCIWSNLFLLPLATELHFDFCRSLFDLFLLKVNGLLPCLAAAASGNLQSRRHLTIHEHQAMDVLKTFDIPVPDYKIANTAEETFQIAEEFGA